MIVVMEPKDILPERARIRREMGMTPDRYRHFVDRFSKQGPALITALQEAVDDGNAEAARQQAHHIKGLAATLRLDGPASWAAVAEQKARRGELSDLAPEIALLREAIETLQRISDDDVS
jgi:HPt (histidine-containing phosphotransfer) domain-containing protein